MAFTPHTLVAIGGKLGTSPYADIWQCGIRLIGHDYVVGGAGLPLNYPGDYGEAIAAAVATWFTAVGTSNHMGPMRQDATLDYLKVNNIGANGKYSDPSNVHIHTFASGTHGAGMTTGTGTQDYMPATLTVAASFTTTRARGRASKGRIYLPFSVGWTPYPYVTPTLQSDVLAKVQSFVHIVTSGSTAGDATPQAAVCSRLDGSVGIINGIRVGNVIDVQRRRKNAFPESYVSGPLT